MPPGRKADGNRWVLTEKDDGSLRSMTVAQGFGQVPGKAFTESHDGPSIPSSAYHPRAYETTYGAIGYQNRFLVLRNS
jgi:hypothetical protein